MNVHELLRRALSELKQDGWTQHAYHNSRGEHCAVGGLEDALEAEFGPGWLDNTKANSLFGQAHAILDDTALDQEGVGSIIGLNDTIGTTFETIRNVFSAAIRRTKEA